MPGFQELLTTAWLGPTLWAAVYVSDYVLTVTCARLYRAQDHIVFEGSYEITPMFQADIDGLRKFSRRFLVALIASTGYLWLVRSVAVSWADYTVYTGVLGAMLLAQATVHIRHLRNWFLFSKGAKVIHGRLAYPRRFLLTMSAFELTLFAGLYLGLGLVTSSVFVLGGGLACGVLAITHYRLARRHAASPADQRATGQSA